MMEGKGDSEDGRITNFILKRVEDGDPDNYSSRYKITANTVYWKGVKIDEADPESFEIMKCDYAENTGKDKNNVYWKGEVIYGTDASSFTGVASNCFDKNGVYSTTDYPELIRTLEDLKGGYEEGGRTDDIVGNSLQTAITTYKTKYPGYTPQPAQPKPGSPEGIELKKFQAEVERAKEEEIAEKKQKMAKWAIGIVAVLALGGISVLIKKRKK